MHKYNNSLQNITSNVYLLAPYCNNSMKSSVDGGKKDNSHFLEEVSIRDNLELLEDQVNAASSAISTISPKVFSRSSDGSASPVCK